MDNAAERAVERVIAVMRDNLDEQLTIDDMAKVAMFSKFHFSRIFQRVTGLSPGRFLSALRLQRAKQLLVSTSYNIADISLRVGYTSVGTFSTRFTRSVGLSPTTYRRQQGVTPYIETTCPNHAVGVATGSMRGVIRSATPERDELIFAGLFRDRIPEGRPVSCTVLAGAGPFLLEKVPPGMWYLLVHSVPAGTETARPGTPGTDQLAAATLGPVAVRQEASIEGVEVQLRSMGSMDPPVLMALLDVRTAALERIGQQRMRRPDRSIR
ncbi:MAG: helix-turn-helix transcriptional regulator [Hamadaea sp.]|nr:helix-turn-helix transcriptional regulator [Hamadaea sp.]NUT03524.1 helix-turn-helix transcriptional regulator [Hamadaea sp.]